MRMDQQLQKDNGSIILALFLLF